MYTHIHNADIPAAAAAAAAAVVVVHVLECQQVCVLLLVALHLRVAHCLLLAVSTDSHGVCRQLANVLVWLVLVAKIRSIRTVFDAFHS